MNKYLSMIEILRNPGPLHGGPNNYNRKSVPLGLRVTRSARVLSVFDKFHCDLMDDRCLYLPEVTLHLPVASPIGALAFSPDGLFFSVGVGRLLQIWDLSHLDAARIEYYAYEEASITCILWNTSGLYCGYSSGEIAVVSLSEDHKVCKSYVARPLSIMTIS